MALRHVLAPPRIHLSGQLLRQHGHEFPALRSRYRPAFVFPEGHLRGQPAPHVAGDLEGQGAGIRQPAWQPPAYPAGAVRRRPRSALHRPRSGQRERGVGEYLPAHVGPAADQPHPVRVRRQPAAGQQPLARSLDGNATDARHGTGGYRRTARPAGRIRSDDVDDVPQHGIHLPGDRIPHLDDEQQRPRVNVICHRQPQPEVRHADQPEVRAIRLQQQEQLDEHDHVPRQSDPGAVPGAAAPERESDQRRPVRAGAVDHRSPDDQRRPALRLLQGLLPRSDRAGDDLGPGGALLPGRDRGGLEGPAAAAGRGVRPARRRADCAEGLGLALRRAPGSRPRQPAQPDRQEHPDAALVVRRGQSFRDSRTVVVHRPGGVHRR